MISRFLSNLPFTPLCPVYNAPFTSSSSKLNFFLLTGAGVMPALSMFSGRTSSGASPTTGFGNRDFLGPLSSPSSLSSSAKNCLPLTGAGVTPARWVFSGREAVTDFISPKLFLFPPLECEFGAEALLFLWLESAALELLTSSSSLAASSPMAFVVAAAMAAAENLSKFWSTSLSRLAEARLYAIELVSTASSSSLFSTARGEEAPLPFSSSSELLPLDKVPPLLFVRTWPVVRMLPNLRAISCGVSWDGGSL
mmetsp:Transcript_15393/g.28762  ORF Transcript_15393/g.28762 Transcript_15393/m.28762 type:complete len:253 (+) Transcript_15393:26-784(+)